MKELPTYQPDFEEYIRQGEPEKRERAQIWRTAIGLQQVDGLETSEYLKKTVKRNIDGEISIDEVQHLIKEYYVNKTNHEPEEEEKREADTVTGNIGKILASDTLDFSANGFISLHRRIFAGVFKHAGQIRTYDITKKEFVLRGGTVSYLNWEDLRRALDYDIEQEKQFSYNDLSQEQVIAHIAQFVSNIWQIHAFGEGNTRTTAVFTIQYLRSIGFAVDNDLFARHSWYFRNALVRANYRNVALKVDYSPVYLERFFRNLLLDEHWDLKSRYLVINPPAEYAEQPMENVGSFVDGLSVVQMTDRQRKIVDLIAKNPRISIKEMSVVLSVVKRTIERDIAAMQQKGIIRRLGNTSAGWWELLSSRICPVGRS